jgi:hypothetical protein
LPADLIYYNGADLTVIDIEERAHDWRITAIDTATGRTVYPIVSRDPALTRHVQRYQEEW